MLALLIEITFSHLYNTKKCRVAVWACIGSCTISRWRSFRDKRCKRCSSTYCTYRALSRLNIRKGDSRPCLLYFTIRPRPSDLISNKDQSSRSSSERSQSISKRKPSSDSKSWYFRNSKSLTNIRPICICLAKVNFVFLINGWGFLFLSWWFEKSTASLRQVSRHLHNVRC